MSSDKGDGGDRRQFLPMRTRAASRRDSAAGDKRRDSRTTSSDKRRTNDWVKRDRDSPRGRPRDRDSRGSARHRLDSRSRSRSRDGRRGSDSDSDSSPARSASPKRTRPRSQTAPLSPVRGSRRDSDSRSPSPAPKQASPVLSPMRTSPPPLPSYFSPVLETGGRSVPIGGGQQMRVDASGTWSAPMPVAKPPKHAETQALARGAGQSVMKSFLSMSDTERAAELKVVERAANASWKQAVNNPAFTPGHDARAQRWSHGGDGAAFRKLDDRLDEASQSQTTSHHFAGQRSAVPSGLSAQQRADATAFSEQSASFLSSLRMLTTDVSAPVAAASGGAVGQRHPTSSQMPKWKGGASAHTQADRERSDAWTRTVNNALASGAGPGTALVAGGLASGSQTLRRMSLPLSASNVSDPGYSAEMKRTQPKRREIFKSQMNAVGETLGLPAHTETQRASSPVRPLKQGYLTSPPREMPKPSDKR